MTFSRLGELWMLFAITIGSAGASSPQPARAPGALIDLGGHRLHVNCIGKGAPTIVVENGFDEFSFDWITVVFVNAISED
jgi:sorbitol-specific phosphotransferase system component IIA